MLIAIINYNTYNILLFFLKRDKTYIDQEKHEKFCIKWEKKKFSISINMYYIFLLTNLYYRHALRLNNSCNVLALINIVEDRIN